MKERIVHVCEACGRKVKVPKDAEKLKTAYVCDYCNLSYPTKKGCEEHEDGCWGNPKSRACGSCKSAVACHGGGGIFQVFSNSKHYDEIRKNGCDKWELKMEKRSKVDSDMLYQVEKARELNRDAKKRIEKLESLLKSKDVQLRKLYAIRGVYEDAFLVLESLSALKDNDHAVEALNNLKIDLLEKIDG